MAQEVAIALLKKRVATFCISKFKGVDLEGEVYEPNRAPSQVLSSIFSSIAAVNSSGVLGMLSSSSSLGWLGRLPAYQVEVIMFLSKVFRGHASLGQIFDDCVTQDKVVAAETALACEKMVKSGMFDLSALLELKKESESQAATEASEPQKVSQDAAAEAQTNDEKPEEPDNATIMADGCEGDHADAPKQVHEPPPLDRLSFFSKMSIPQVIVSVLEKHSDLYFEQVLEWAQVRARAFMAIEVKATTGQGLKDQLAQIKGDSPCLFIMDVKSRLRLPLDGILERPFKRPVPLNSAAYRKLLHALWNDPSKDGTLDAL